MSGGGNIGEAYDKAFATDLAFGGIIANDALRSLLELLTNSLLMVIAPSVDATAAGVAKELMVADLRWWSSKRPAATRDKRVGGGLLVQDADGLANDDALRVEGKLAY